MQNKIQQTYKLVHIKYLVMFKDNDTAYKPYAPILKIKPKDLTALHEQGGHLFDPDMKNILPAIKYILHLPRIGFDAIDINAEMALSSHDCPHDILLFPASAAQLICKIPQFCNTLLIYEDCCEAEAKYFQDKDFIDVVPISSLSSSLLYKHWNKIAGLMQPLNKENCLPAKMELLDGEKLFIIPQLFLLNHIQQSDVIFRFNSYGLELFTDIYQMGLNVHSHILLLNEMENNPTVDIKKAEQKFWKTTRIPVVVTMMGRPVYQKNLTKTEPKITDIERDVCRIMATHRACARDGVVIELNDTPKELFMLLEQLEEHCKSRSISNSYVWSTLKKIGKIFTEHVEIEKGSSMVRASHITAFTDFPIGLAIMPSGSSPLCCYSSISYRPITPLTRALQLECPKSYQHYIGKECKIVIAECLDRNDYIRGLSEGAWRGFADRSKEQVGLTVIFEEIDSVEKLKNLLTSHNDTDILVISAHGAYEKKSNVAGLCIGNDIWLGDDNDMRMPPLVMLSACHVSPRGAGSVNVTDLLLRAGAKAVLGTFIPVDVRRNSLLYIRFFVYIQEAMNGSKSYQTILDAWSGVVATNAVNEIVYENTRLHQWFMSPNKSGTKRVADFMKNRSKGRLHGANIYNETVEILREMAIEDGLGAYFDAVIKSQGFFPESLFYQMIGFPENIFLYHPAYDKLS